MEKSIRIRKMAKVAVEDRQDNHQEGRRQDEADHGDACSTPAPKFQANVSRKVAGRCSWQTLGESKTLSKLVICEPTTLYYREGSDLGDNRKSSAKSN